MDVRVNADLTGLNTFGFASTAKYLCLVEDSKSLQEAILLAKQEGLPLFVLGGGSNLVLDAELEAVVVKLCDQSVVIEHESEAGVSVSVGAGKSWHEWVEESIANGWYGLENLALIPGTVGAAPVQNIGAYGVELKDCLEYLEVWDTQRDRLVKIQAAECDFGYRQSRFKYQDAGRYIILRVVF
ncbi:MAG: FAD-binding protein, partial [Pontibacterium sp.]